MKFDKIIDPYSGASYNMVLAEDFERISPVDFIFSAFFKTSMMIYHDYPKVQKLNISKNQLNKLLLKKTLSEWDTEYNKIITRAIPSVLLELLESKSKKEQIRLLKNLVLTTDQWITFITKAYLDYNYLFSQYTSTHYSKGYSNSDFPKVIHKQGDKIIRIGETKLSDGQLRQIVDQQNVKVFKFLDRGEIWHCFFLTYKSLKGEEKAYKNGQPHLHYISDKWGLTREYVLDQLKSREYKFPSIPHIDHHTHRNPIDTDENGHL